jgi:hypothetical protein
MPDLPKPEKRKPLTRVQFATLILAQDGRCGCGCRKKLQADAIIDEHVQALDFLGSNALDNRSLWDRDCSKAKTARDLSAAAKGKRIRGETGTGPKKAIPSRPFSQMAEGRDPKRWQSAGFDRSKTRGFNGKVRERT